jgi:hypothetical protein
MKRSVQRQLRTSNFEPSTLNVELPTAKMAAQKTDVREVEFEVLQADRQQPGTTDKLGTTDIDAAIGLVARFMDSIFRVPGTKFRFGMNPIIGYIPVVGDQIDAVISASVILRSVKHRLPKIVLARMGLNVLLNAFFQGIPLIGDSITLLFKANQQNYRLLQKYAGQGKPVTISDWIFVFGMVGGTIGLAMLLSSILIYAVFSQFRLW